MASIEELLAEMKATPVNVRFADARKVADHFFGEPTQRGTSQRAWKMPWPGNPRVNMQSDKGKAKAYQVRQLLEAVERRMNQVMAQTEEARPEPHEREKKGKKRRR